MKIAVTYENGQIFQHFGHTEQFKLYDVADGSIVRAEVVDTNGSGHGALAGFLMQRGVDTLICGGIGGGAQMALAEAGIKLYGGVSGNADAAVAALAQLPQPVAFVLWGAQAQKKAAACKASPHPRLVLEAPHPSPLSAYRGFFGSRPFSQINAFLTAHGEAPINWKL